MPYQRRIANEGAVGSIAAQLSQAINAAQAHVMEMARKGGHEFADLIGVLHEARAHADALASLTPGVGEDAPVEHEPVEPGTVEDAPAEPDPAEPEHVEPGYNSTDDPWLGAVDRSAAS